MKQMHLLLFFIMLFCDVRSQHSLQNISVGTSESLVFVENRGQVVDQDLKPRKEISFHCSTKGLSFYFEKNVLSYQLSKPIREKNRESETDGQVVVSRVDVRWVGSNENPSIEASGKTRENRNYYTRENSGEITGVACYTSLKFQQLYNGVDLRYTAKDGSVNYELLIAPGTDLQMIRREYLGAEDMAINASGQIIISTPAGDVVEDAPKAFQSGKELQAEWILSEGHVSISIPEYDASLPLFIDPYIRRWGSYFGGENEDEIRSGTLDDSSNIYLTGVTRSVSHIATTGAYQTTLNYLSDAFLVKFNSCGVRMWSTYYGGLSQDEGLSCATDQQFNVYLVGKTESLTGISTSGSHQPMRNASSSTNGFLCKFDHRGIRSWATYFGGEKSTVVTSCSTDKQMNVIISGNTTSQNGISSPGAYQNSLQGGTDGFVAKFDASGNLLWSTYFGGTKRDEINHVSVDARNSEILITGFTLSTANMATSGSHQSVFGGGQDAYISKFNASGNHLWSSYYGGTDYDLGQCAFFDDSSNIYLVGTTNSLAAISTPGAYSTTVQSTDAFLVKFNSSGVRQWGTYYGDFDSERGNYGAVNANGDVFIIGDSHGSHTLSTSDGFQPNHAGEYDAFIARFSPSGSRTWGTYYGTADQEFGNFIALDPAQNIIIAGLTYGNTGLSTTGSHQPVGNGNFEGYLARFETCEFYPNVVPSGLTLYSNIPNATYQWVDCGNSMQPLFGATGPSYSPTQSGQYAVEVTLACCVKTSACASFTVGIESSAISGDAIEVFPNPSDGRIHIHSNTGDSGMRLELFDTRGQLLDQKTFSGVNQISYELPSLPGLYLLKVKNSDKEMTFRLLRL